MTTYSDNFPGLLAPLLDDELATEFLSKFRVAVQAWEAVRCHPLPAVKQIAKGSVLQGVTLQWLVFFASRTGWKTVVPQMRVLLQTLFSGFCQSRINEHTNQKLRDHEFRDNMSRVLRHLTMNMLPVSHHVLGTFKRNELEPETLAAKVPSAAEMDRLFVVPSRKSNADIDKLPEIDRKAEIEQNQWDDELKKIMGSQIWERQAPGAKALRAAEMQFMITMHQQGGWDMVHDIWRSRFFPQHEVPSANTYQW